MKITKKQLKQIIKEELAYAIQEKVPHPDPNRPETMPKGGSMGAVEHTLTQHNEEMKRLSGQISQILAWIDKQEGVTRKSVYDTSGKLK